MNENWLKAPTIDRRSLLMLLAAGVAHPRAAMASIPAAARELDVEPVTVTAGLRHPWAVAFLPSGEFLVTEKDGTVVRVGSNGSVSQLEGLPADVDTERKDPRDNSGWFDVALHPDFRRNGQLFLTYASRAEGGTTTRLVAARLTGNRLTDLHVVFDALPRSADRFHYGGALLVANGHLFLSVGERHFNERDNPPLPAAQDPADRRGKIYRFTLEGKLAPPAETAPHAWFASGIRATQGMARRPGTGQIWFTDHGSIGGDELNLLRAGANYGWPVRTGGKYRNADYVPQRTLERARYTDPVHDWVDRTVAPTGLVFYDGSVFPEWRGHLLVAGLSRGNLIRVVLDGDRVEATFPLMRTQPTRLRNVKVAPSGQLYAVTDESNGRLLRLDRRE